MNHSDLSETALSNLYTMTIASQKDGRQAIPPMPQLPCEAIRKLRAQLILEEALETIRALGFEAVESYGEIVVDECEIKPDMEKAIDGACDTIYVSVGMLCSFGVPDLPHLRIVNAANNVKFPNGVGIFSESGKFLKPEGWQPPDHREVLNKTIFPLYNLKVEGERLVRERSGK